MHMGLGAERCLRDVCMDVLIIVVLFFFVFCRAQPNKPIGPKFDVISLTHLHYASFLRSLV
jgi:hypothetical protein